MKRLLLIAPSGAAVYLAAYALTPAHAVHLVRQVLLLIAAALAALACLRTARGFEPGALLRRAWLANGGSFAFVALEEIGILTLGGNPYMNAALIGASNVLGVLSMWIFAHAYQAGGLELPGSRARRGAALALAFLLGVACAGWPLVESIRQVAGGDPAGLDGVASALGDIAIFTLMAPIFFTVTGLAGGLLVWPWGFFFASDGFWLTYDAHATLAGLLGGKPPGWIDVWLIVGAALAVAAALAQRRILAGEDEASPDASDGGLAA